VRILVVGAGAIGGYFGGRLLEAGRDVTFLVRPRRASELAESGLRIRSPLGDVTLRAPRTVLAADLASSFDLVLLSCKAYDLQEAIASIAPAVGPQTAILPLLNGMRHTDLLAERFGTSRVLGGLCVISVLLTPDGVIDHLSEFHDLAFGELPGARSHRIESVASALLGAGFDSRLSTAILQEMWEKWVFIATMAGMTCLMRAAVGDIVAAGATDLVTALLDECSAIARGQGFTLSAAALERMRAMLTMPGSTLMASMLRDIERGSPIEGDHILGDLARRGDEAPLLRVAYAQVKAYEARRAREGHHNQRTRAAVAETT